MSEPSNAPKQVCMYSLKVMDIPSLVNAYTVLVQLRGLSKDFYTTFAPALKGESTIGFIAGNKDFETVEQRSAFLAMCELLPTVQNAAVQVLFYENNVEMCTVLREFIRHTAALLAIYRAVLLGEGASVASGLPEYLFNRAFDWIIEGRILELAL